VWVVIIIGEKFVIARVRGGGRGREGEGGRGREEEGEGKEGGEGRGGKGDIPISGIVRTWPPKKGNRQHEETK
jgi:hypothetical protein